jgi:hypothetical protein
MNGQAAPPAVDPAVDPAVALARVERALRTVTAPFPYLAGLAATARPSIDSRVPTMGVFASGRIVAHPGFVCRLNDADLLFVVAHELLHLALYTHRRARGSDPMQFNVAHDYIINDILRAELGVTRIPAGGLDMPGARLRSAEAILLELRREARAAAAGGSGSGAAPRRVWSAAAGEAAGPDDGGDVLRDELERDWFGDDRDSQHERRRAAEDAARRALAIARAGGTPDRGLLAQMGIEPGGRSESLDAKRGLYRTPAFLAVQRWIESVAMGPRTFERPSRRATGLADTVLPGRRRTSQALNVVLDTSGSMSDELPRALGAIGDFCDALGIDHVRLVQCDAAVTADDRVEPQRLSRYRIDGYGGSDLSPALRHLAADPQVLAVIAITDGDILVPEETLPYELLWLLPPGASVDFRPGQGRVVHLSPREA